jgi:uncharacterized protein YjbI with pentapeptide repeats
MSNITKDKLKDIVRSHNVWLKNEEGGQRADLSYVTTSISFSGIRHSLGSDWSSLRGANFRSSNLKGIDFSHCDLRNCNFAGANLEYANFSYCILKGANFRSANLKNAIFIGAHLERCEFNHTDLRYAKLYDATFSAELYSADSLHDIGINKNAFHFLMLNSSFAKNPVCRFPWKSSH